MCVSYSSPIYLKIFLYMCSFFESCKEIELFSVFS